MIKKKRIRLKRKKRAVRIEVEIIVQSNLEKKKSDW